MNLIALRGKDARLDLSAAQLAHKSGVRLSGTCGLRRHTESCHHGRKKDEPMQISIVTKRSRKSGRKYPIPTISPKIISVFYHRSVKLSSAKHRHQQEHFLKICEKKSSRIFLFFSKSSFWLHFLTTIQNSKLHLPCFAAKARGTAHFCVFCLYCKLMRFLLKCYVNNFYLSFSLSIFYFKKINKIFCEHSTNLK